MSDYDSIFTDNGKSPAYYRGEVDVDKIVSERKKEIQAKERAAAYHGYVEILSQNKGYKIDQSASRNLDIQGMIRNTNKNDAENVVQGYRKNSVGEKPTVRMSDKKKVQSDKAEKAAKARLRAVAVVFAVGIAVGALGHSFSAKLNDSSDAYRYLHQYQYILNENIHNNMNGRLDDYWYDTDQMGKEVAKSNDPQLALYEVYNGLHYKPVSNTSEVFTCAKTYARKNGIDAFANSFGDCETFDDYVRSLGCVDKNGETDFKAYKNSMEQIALAKSMVDDATKNATTISNESSDGKGGK